MSAPLQLRSLRLGVMGCGKNARNHLAVWRQLGGIEVVGCWNRPEEEEYAAEFAELAGAAYATGDFERLAADPAIEAVYICTMQNDRVRLLEAAARHGKAVFMEKPLGLYREDFIRMREILEQHPVLFQAGYKIRFNTAVAALRRFLPAPEHVYAHVLADPWPDTAPAARPEVGGGNLYSQGVYAADAISAVAAGEPVAVQAMHVDRGGGRGTLNALYRYADGRLAALTVSDCCEAPPGVSKFMLQAVDRGRSAALTDRFTHLALRDGVLRTVWAHTFAEEGFRLENQHFFRCLRHPERRNRCPFRAGALPSAMLFAAVEAARLGREIPFDLDDFLR